MIHKYLNITDFCKNPNDSTKVGFIKFLLFIAILMIPTGFISFLANQEIPGRDSYPYADVDRFSPKADSLRDEYKAFYEEIYICALEKLSQETYTPREYVEDVAKVNSLDTKYQNISFTIPYGFYFHQDLLRVYPKFFPTYHNQRWYEFTSLSQDREEASRAIDHSNQDIFSLNSFLLWILKWYLGALPFAFLLCCILAWQRRIVFSFKTPMSSISYLILWPVNFFVRIRRRVLDIDTEARIRMSKDSLFTKLSEKEKQFLQTYSLRKNSGKKLSWYQDVVEQIESISRFSVRYMFALLVVLLSRVVVFACDLSPQKSKDSVEISTIAEPPDIFLDDFNQDINIMAWFDNWILRQEIFIEDLEKKKSFMFKLSLLSGYIQGISKIPLGVNTLCYKQK